MQLSQLDSQLIDLALVEDLGVPFQDLTSMALFHEFKGFSSATVVSKHAEPSVLCGLPVVRAILERVSQRFEIASDFQDGDVIAPGATIMTIQTDAQNLLMCERTMLNFLQRLSAIATLTAKFVTRVNHTKAKILDTRKTLPGNRHLEKYAVLCGGGVNHRMGLYDALMIKDTHIDLLGGVHRTLELLPEHLVKTYPVIVEVRNVNELMQVLEIGLHKISRVLLDNMPPTLIKTCVDLCVGKVPTEASGNIHLDNVAEIAETGVDFISVGKLTHSAGNIDLSMLSKYNHG